VKRNAGFLRLRALQTPLLCAASPCFHRDRRATNSDRVISASRDDGARPTSANTREPQTACLVIPDLHELDVSPVKFRFALNDESLAGRRDRTSAAGASSILQHPSNQWRRRMTSQFDRKLTLAESQPLPQETVDDAVDRALKAILDLNPCLRPGPHGRMKQAA
jgi:hypothetical protein